jgi:phosphomannomutase
MSPWAASLLPGGKAQRIDDARGRYVEFCKNTFPNELDLRGMKIASIAPMVRPTWLHPRCFTSWG